MNHLLNSFGTYERRGYFVLGDQGDIITSFLKTHNMLIGTTVYLQIAHSVSIGTERVNIKENLFFLLASEVCRRLWWKYSQSPPSWFFDDQIIVLEIELLQIHVHAPIENGSVKCCQHVMIVRFMSDIWSFGRLQELLMGQHVLVENRKTITKH